VIRLENPQIKIDAKTVGIVCLIVAIVVPLFLFGVVGLKFIIGAMLIFIVPTYILLYSAELETDEKLILAIMLGIGIFSFLVYGLDVLVRSLKSDIIIIFLFVSLGGYLLYMNKKKRQSQSAKKD
jgi:hypothetical protein